MNMFAEVVKTLRSAFPDVKIYGEQIPQSFRVPCFSVQLVKGEHALMLGNRRQGRASFDVRYFPAEGLDACAQCRDMGEQLKYVLEIVSDNVARGRDMEYNIVDQVLHFTFSCSWFERLINEDSNTMDDLEVNSGIQNED